MNVTDLSVCMKVTDLSVCMNVTDLSVCVNVTDLCVCIASAVPVCLHSPGAIPGAEQGVWGH